MIAQIALWIFYLAGMCGLVRLLLGPRLADRILALDVMFVALMGAVIVDAAHQDDSTNLVLLVVVALVGFTATVATSRFLEDEASDGFNSPLSDRRAEEEAP